MSTYTPEQAEQVVAEYKNGTTVEDIAKMVGHSARSVIAKLSREKVYVAKAKTSAERLTKDQMIDLIAATSGVPRNQLESLSKATHAALESLVEFAVTKE